MMCIDCGSMWCKEFDHKKEIWTGFCPHLRKEVKGSDKCRVVKELELFQ